MRQTPCRNMPWWRDSASPDNLDNDINPIKIKKEKTIYYNVFLFIERLRIKKNFDNSIILIRNLD